MQHDTTLVTGFFPLSKSKHSIDRYREWIRRFCQIDMPLVVYVPGSHADWFRSFRDPAKTRIIETELDALNVAQPKWRAMWSETWARDPEKSIHGPELYSVWAAKQELVAQTIKLNPFGSNLFVWMDAGMLRNDAMLGMLRRPFCKLKQTVAPGRMLFLEVARIPEPLVDVFLHRPGDPIERHYGDALGGGVIAGDHKAWEDFSRAYQQCCQEMHASHIFVGKDQSVFLAMLLHRKTTQPYRLVHTHSDHHTDQWMSMPAILSGSFPLVIDERFEPGYAPPHPDAKQTRHSYWTLIVSLCLLAAILSKLSKRHTIN